MTTIREQVLQNINLCSYIHKTHKKNILDKLLNMNKDLATQGSAAWLADRVYNIGGSEMSTITGDNPYSKIDKLVAQKIGISTFTGNTATRWGQLFENVTQRITEIIFDISDGIKETGSLCGAVPHQKYSPDGLAVIKMKCVDTINGRIFETEEYCIVLFEFKSPLMSIPDGKIPKHYIPQVKTGLCSIDIADFAIFISNMFRKCSFEQLGNSPDYDDTFHNKDKKSGTPAKVSTSPLAFGMILFYQTEDQKQRFYQTYESQIKPPREIEFNYDSDDSDEEDSDANNSDAEDPDYSNKYSTYTYSNVLYKHIYGCAELNYTSSDFGKSYYNEFNDLLELISNNYISVEYCEPHILESYNSNKFLAAQNINARSADYGETIEKYKYIIANTFTQTGEKIFGYLPWKLIKSDIIYADRDPSFVLRYNTKIQETIGIIKSINELKTQSDKISKFRDYFPRSNILREENLDNTYTSEFMPKNL